MIFCLSVFLFEGILTHLFLNEYAPLAGVLSIHYLGVIVAYLILKSQKFRHKKINFYLISLIMTGVAGIFGAGVGVLTVFLFWFRKTTKIDILMALGLHDQSGKPVDEEPRLIASLSEKDLHNKAGVIPFNDIILSGTVPQKVEILSKISRHYLPQFAPILLKAKHDEKNNIRVLAASTIAKINYQFMKRYKYLLLKHRQYPDSPVILLNLARHASIYADCGVLDKFRQRHFRDTSILYFKLYLKINPLDKESLLTLAKLYLRNGEAEQSIETFKLLLSHNISLTIIDLFWYLEALYEARHFDSIRQQVAFFESKGLLTPTRDFFVLDTILKPWLQGLLRRADNQ